MGRPAKLTEHQKREAIRRRDYREETLAYNAFRPNVPSIVMLDRPFSSNLKFSFGVATLFWTIRHSGIGCRLFRTLYVTKVAS